MDQLFGEVAEPSAGKLDAPSFRRLRWPFLGSIIALAWGFAYSTLLAIDVGLGWFEGSLESMIQNHPAFAALWFLAEPAFTVYSTFGPIAGMMLGVLGGRLCVGVIVWLFSMPITTFEALFALFPFVLFVEIVARRRRRIGGAPATRRSR